MDIEFFLPKGPQPTEMEGLEEMRRILPRAWKGFANFVMRQQGRRGQDREIDLVLICPDRIVLADLKHIRGRIENRGGFWYREDENLGSSPAHKIRENAKMLASLIRSEVNQLPSVPPVESVVILTHQSCDPSGLDQVERDRTIKLSDFLKIGREIHFKALFTTPTKYEASNALNSGNVVSALQKFFRNGKLFEPRKTQFHGFVPTGDPEFTHRLFTEFACHQPQDPNYTGLLRLWDFSVDGDFIVEEARRPIAERERAVLGHIRVQDPTLYDNYVLRSIQHDGEFTLRYSEVFDRLPDLERLARFYGVLKDLPIERRIELARLLLDRVASLHRIRVAHRDLDRHSVWIDERRSKVVLSGFGASHFPERRSIAGTRSKLLAGGVRVPEDLGEVVPGTPFQQDVFLVGALVWTLLSGKRLETLDQVPMWTSDSMKGVEVPSIFGEWFARCLKINAAERYHNGVDAADAFSELARKTEKASLEKQLEGYRRDIDPISDYVPVEWVSAKPYRIYKSRKNEENLFVKSWPERTLGERRKSAARLIEFFGKADALRQLDAEWLPRIDVACLCTDGLLLVEEWIDGECLSKCDTSLWSPEKLRRFVTALAEAVEELHEVDLVHGDISPDNIIVRVDGDRPRPVLVDIADFTADEKGRSTPAYCPPDDSDLRVRDRFAVGQIAVELADRCADDETKALLLLGAGKCAEGAAPWLTLKGLKDAISMRRPRPAAVRLELTIETPRAGFEGMMLSDNGVFHIVKSKKAPDSIEISGFDQRVIVDFDPRDRKPIHAIAGKIDMRGAAWAQNHRAFSFEGSVSVRRARPTRFSGFEDLFSLLAAPATVVPPEEPGLPEATPQARQAAAAPEMRPSERFPVARFWQETIAAEEEISPEIKLASEPKYDEGERTLYLVAEDNLPDVDPADGQSVGINWNGYKLGDLDTERSRGTTVVIRNVRRARGLHKGAVLKVPDDLISFQRRSRAVARILEGKSQIANLIRYFDPSGELAPDTFGPEITDDDIKPYGLNPDQGEAFRHLWKNGPVGLLQGPPGTGKTKFIASFAHYALTKARLRNVLVLSQSHEAVNTAAERILQVSAKLDGSVDLLRVGQHSKISPMLHKYHARAIQDRYRELFRAGTKERIVAPATRLGLEKGYIDEAIEIETTLGSLARQIELCEQDIATSRDQDTVMAARERSAHLREIWKESVGSYPVAQDGEPREVLNEIREAVAARHAVNDPDGRRRLLKIHRLAQEWTSALGMMRGRSLEELVARSRNLICGTCVGIGRHGIQVDRNVFDLVIIDEAARCTPGELAVGMQSGRRVLLVGDHKQLPPLYGHELIEAIGERLKVSSRKELKRSDFERAFHSTYGREVARSLLIQYRMAPKIGRLVAKSFYPGQDLKTERGDPPEYYGLLPSPLDDEIVWIDTGYSNSTRRESEAKSSFFNRREAIAVISILQAISRSTAFVQAAIADDLREDEPLIGVICMYAPQVSLIEEMLVTSDLPSEFKKLVKVGTVDSYQGKENRIIVVSLVRSNPEHHMGFVRTANRINVALSRAMERLVIIGSSKMFEKQGNALSAVVRQLRAAKRIVGDGKGAR